MMFHHRLNTNFLFLIKILSLVIITWVCYFHKEHSCGKSLNRIHKQQGRVDLRNKRLLSIFTNSDENTTESNDSAMYSTMSKDLKSLKDYRRKYNRRRRKPNIFKRIDQYFEKKIFSAFDEVYTVGVETNSDPAKIKKQIVKTVLKVLTPQLILYLFAVIIFIIEDHLPAPFDVSCSIVLVISLLGCFYVFIKAFKYSWKDISSYMRELYN